MAPSTAKPKPVASYSEAREILVEIIEIECMRRAKLYQRMSVYSDDDDETKQLKVEYCVLRLTYYSRNPLEFIRDFGWAPDPKGLFGGRGKISEGLAPPGMVPLMLSPAQEGFMQELADAMLSDEEVHVNLLKSRQLACTTMVLMLFIWALLFQPGFTIGICSYEESQIDPGGSGHRTADALFPRMRMMFDAIARMVPALAFNQQMPVKWQRDEIAKGNYCRFNASQDTKMKITRPPWVVYKREMFPAAVKNYIRGAPPSEKFLQGDICTVILLDEFGLFNAKKSGLDKATRDSVLQSCPCILTQGTIPEGGGLDSHFKKLHEQGHTNTALVNIELDWSDVQAYMLLAKFKCTQCEKLSKFGAPQPGPGPHGIEKECQHCGTKVQVHRFSAKSIPPSEDMAHTCLQPGEVISPWWIRKMAANSFDRTALARFFLRDWMASVGDRAFWAFNRTKAVVARPNVSERRLWWRSIDTYDPGTNEENPAAWVAVRFSERLMVPRVVAWHMAANKFEDWWVPFFKRWSPQKMRTMPIIGGANAGKYFPQVHEYNEADLAMMQYASQIGDAHDRDRRFRGDKYGTHHTGASQFSEYEVLERYRIDMDSEYNTDREVLLRRLRETWISRIEIDPFVAEHRPLGPGNEAYPTIVECIESARMRTTTGQNKVKRDIDHNNPKYVSHPIDALIYMARELPDRIEAHMTQGGVYEVDAMQEAEYVAFGDDFMG